MRTLSGRQVGNLSSGIAVAVTALGLARAVTLRWTCDDAWISFRYAGNLANGLGLVFNAGERVEGYTNFLWVLVSVPAFLLHVPPEVWANLWSLASFGAAVGLLAIRARLRRRESGGTLSPIPVAAAVVALNPDVQIWATGGLETSLFSALLVAGFVLLVGNDLRTDRVLASGAVFGLAALTRPDGILPAAVAAAWCAVFCRDRRVEKTLAFVAGVSLLVVPHLLWRYSYYRDWLPNTYYAKSAWLPWWEQGFVYVGLFFEQHFALLLGGPLLLGAILRVRRRGSPGQSELSFILPEGVLAAGIAVAYGLFVARVGGDFMYARLLIPIVPFLGILVELAVGTPSLPIGLRAATAGAALLLPLLIKHPVPADRWVQGVADERAFYTRDRVALVDAAGAELRRFFTDLPVRVLAVGSEMRLACRSEAFVVIEAHGLTDTRIARQPLGVRGRVGHEHLADLEYVTRERRAHFMFHPPWSEYPNFRDVSPVVPAKLGSSVLYVLTWDAPLMAELSRRGAEIPDFPQTLDRYLAGIDALSDETVQRDYVRCKNFYFDHVEDRAREAIFRRRLHLP